MGRGKKQQPSEWERSPTQRAVVTHAMRTSYPRGFYRMSFEMTDPATADADARWYEALYATPAVMFSWLSDFAACDLASADRRSLARRAERFAMMVFVYDDHTAPYGFGDEPWLPYVEEIQGELRRVLGELREHGRCHLGQHRPEFILTWLHDDGWDRGNEVFMTVGGTPVAQFMFAVGQLLSSFEGQMRACDAPGCGRFFLAARPHQKRCTATCTNKANAAAYRVRHTAEEIADARSKSYAKKRARAAGVKSVKVKRRPGVGGRKPRAAPAAP